MQRIFIVRQGDLKDHLPAIEPWLVRMAKDTQGRRTPEDIIQRMLRGECQLWVTLDADGKPNGAVITSIEQYPQMRMLNILHAAGEKNRWKDIEDDLYAAYDEFAKANGCVGVEFGGRPGWKKYAEPRGFKLKSVMYEKRFA